MEFRNNQAIYLQIAEMVCENILLVQWREGEKIPSVRELAVSLEVNPNTVARTYEFLTQKEIIFTKRGMGYFVTEDGKSKALAFRKEDFLKNDLPLFFRNIDLLNIDFDELRNRFEIFKKEKTETFSIDTKI
ncbi:GntR family transcriptional regulator [Emticicia sp. BO119]|uniref:GntR family transcriptional regulator n=1 Tax=Emticicia sp. BO119 TaxID=2757768 RepID=UPI0015F0953B|nr:GntR family transcriptional regulator [Emticicia sp. BO119]MBA4853665.1 GntR family transcriptional regulator [Emticicia sp. BO119]